MTIWPQEYDTALKAWIRGPVNLMRLGKCMAGDKVEQLSRGPDTSDLHSIIRRLTFSKDLFNVPPDFGSTFINIGLGSVLRSMNSYFVGAYDTWTSNFANSNSVMASLKYHAYRPFSSTRQASNVVDTRTYFFLRKFLQEAKGEQKDVLLVPLWVWFRIFIHFSGNCSLCQIKSRRNV
ncbi:uncharacterized protein LOC110461020 [Mizuhopecten yessoensis]|nr:uncharacterized protein LOC110461020 [Mizuhopecten yessoensis]